MHWTSLNLAVQDMRQTMTISNNKQKKKENGQENAHLWITTEAQQYSIPSPPTTHLPAAPPPSPTALSPALCKRGSRAWLLLFIAEKTTLVSRDRTRLAVCRPNTRPDFPRSSGGDNAHVVVQTLSLPCQRCRDVIGQSERGKI